MCSFRRHARRLTIAALAESAQQPLSLCEALALVTLLRIGSRFYTSPFKDIRRSCGRGQRCQKHIDATDASLSLVANEKRRGLFSSVSIDAGWLNSSHSKIKAIKKNESQHWSWR